MKKWFENLSYKLQVFMQGRYGRDELSGALSICALVLIILAFIRPLRFLVYIALIILIWSIFRSYSKNRAKRVEELNKYLKIKNFFISKFKLIKGMIRDRNTHLYVKCPDCKQYIRLRKPSKKGITISINCPKCKNNFTKKV